MKNWAGNLEFFPKRVLTPKNTQEACELVKDHLKSGQKIRMRGSAHSWTGLIACNDSFLHLDEMQGLISADKEQQTVTVKAGTKLKRFGEEAFTYNLSLPNQGDVDHQSVAGAMSTGTHGTGITLQSMANMAQELTLVTGTGDIVSIKGEKLKALGVSFGSAGLITEATLKLVPAYKLRVETFAEDMQESLKALQHRLQGNRHLEMFYFPVGKWSIVKMMNQTEEQVSPPNKLEKISELVLDNWLYEQFNKFANLSKTYKTLDPIMRKFVGPKVHVNWSHRAFPTERTVRFMEMEYNLPIEKFEMVFAEMRQCIAKNNFQTLFPIEIRFVKGDDLWLSPAYQRDSVYFAIHTYKTENYRPYFEAMESIFSRHGGRPHWGKWHSQKNAYFETVYPKWDQFKKIRSELDPQGTWINEHLKGVFDLD